MPFIPPPTGTGFYTSSTVHELSRKLTDVVEEYRRSHPTLSSREIRQALQVTARSTGGMDGRRVAVLAAAIAASLVFGLTASLRGGAHGPDPSRMVVPLALGVILLGVIAVLVVARR